MRIIVRFWLPVILWMAVIFVGSTDVLSTERTSRFIGPFLRWFKPDISNEMIKRVQTIVRKGGHITEYAILAILCWRAVTVGTTSRNFSGSHRAGIVLAITALYAVSDEVHQSFVASRLGSAWDVLIDLGGAGMGLILIWTWQRLRDYS